MGYEKKSFSSFNLDKNKSINIEGGRYVQQTNDGEEIIVDVVINEIESDSDQAEYIALIIDKTKELEFEKRKFDVVSQAEESEKKKIARELHDGLGQQMVLLNLLFQNFNPSDGQKESFNDLQNLLQNCIREVKEIAYNLLPPELEKGFLNAIERFARRISSMDQIQFVIDIEEGIAVIFKYYREQGFPHYTIRDDEKYEHMKKLKKFDVDTIFNKSYMLKG